MEESRCSLVSTPRFYEIATPENVRFHVEVAGLASRAWAWTIDLVVIAGIVQLGAALLRPLEKLSGSMVTALVIVLGFVVQWGYGALCEWHFSGRTCGKWLVGIATCDMRGLRLSLFQCAVRNLVRIVDILPGIYLVGGLSAWLDPWGRRLGDRAAGTLVIVDRRTRLGRAHPSFDRSLLAGAAPRLSNVRLNARERDALVSLCAQRETLPLALRVELFERMARHVEALGHVERPAHVSAENLILQVLAGLDRPWTGQES